MSATKVKLRRGALTPFLTGEPMRAELRRRAEPVARRAAAATSRVAPAAKVGVQDWYTNDRAVVQVFIDDRNGAGIEAKYRPMRNAAADFGLVVGP